MQEMTDINNGIISEAKEEYEVGLKSENDANEMFRRQSTNALFKQRSAMPSCAKRCEFEWKDLDVYVGNAKDGKQILHNFNGSIQSGELLAVMGGSGAGKSTLLNALSGRTNLNQQTVNGYLAINNKQFKCSHQKIIKSICTFVPQSDELCATQTVQEALLFYAKLKLSNCPLKQQQKRINYLINVLHLNKCRNSYIGSESKRGISGGEKRRVSIAAEILNDTDIIFLDEPTSGLDAYTAARTIKTLKQFCLVSNKIIIATIHQPSIEVFYLFDKLILLSNGRCCFNSYIKDVDTYFKDKLRPKTNPADVIVFEVQRNTNLYAGKWTNYIENCSKKHDYEAWNEYGTFELNDPKNSIKTHSKTAAIKLQYVLLLQRELRALIRNKRVTVMRLIQVIFFALASGLCYFHIAQTFRQRVAAFFLLTIMPLLFGIVSLLTAFPAQKLLFQREYNSRTYDITPWALSFMIIEIPREVLHMLLFTVIIYFMIDLDGNIFEYWLTFFLTSVSGGSFGILFGTICKTTVEAAQAVPAALIPLLIFSDGLITLSHLPVVIQWIGAINPMYYLIRCFYIIEFYGVIYPRQLSQDEQKLCDYYNVYTNLTSINREYLKNYNVVDQDINKTIYSICYNNSYTQYGIPTDLNQLNDTISKFHFNSTNTNDMDYFNLTTSTTQNEYQEKIDLLCGGEASWEYFFHAKSLHANALIRYWITVIVICVILRIMSILILLAMNNNVFSWIQKKINTIIKCKCNKTESKLKNQFDIRQMKYHLLSDSDN